MIEVRGLGLRTGGASGVRDLSFRVERGEIFGLIGPIGSGKSTTLKLLAGMAPATAGTIAVDGIDATAGGEEARARIGYMPGYMGAYDDLSVRGYLEFFARAGRSDPAEAGARIDRLLAMAGLAAQEQAYLSALDDEARRRLAVVKAAVTAPPVLLFDEPAVGLPVSGRVRLKRLIAEVAAEGECTVVICANILTDLVGLCRCIGVMHGGRMIASGPAEAMAKRLTGARIVELEPTGSPEALMEALRKLPQVRAVEIYGGHVLASIDGDVEDSGEIARLAAREAPVAAFREHQIDLDLLMGRLVSG